MLMVIYSILTGLHLFFFMVGAQSYARSRSVYSLLALIPLAGLAYDNGVIAIGVGFGESDFLKALNAGRYIIHAILTPLLILWAVSVAQRRGAAWAQKRGVWIGFTVLTVAMIAFGFYTDVIRLLLKPVQELGTLRYIAAARGGPPIPAIITIFVMMGVGLYLWIKQKWAWMFVGGFVMLVAAPLGARLTGLANTAEVVMNASIVASDQLANGDLDEVNTSARRATA